LLARGEGVEGCARAYVAHGQHGAVKEEQHAADEKEAPWTSVSYRVRHAFVGASARRRRRGNEGLQAPGPIPAWWSLVSFGMLDPRVCPPLSAPRRPLLGLIEGRVSRLVPRGLPFPASSVLPPRGALVETCPVARAACTYRRCRRRPRSLRTHVSRHHCFFLSAETVPAWVARGTEGRRAGGTYSGSRITTWPTWLLLLLLMAGRRICFPPARWR
jgi:hypothetical protein